MATREEHRQLARELLLAYAHRQDPDAVARLSSRVDPRELEILFDHPDKQARPRVPRSYLVLPKLTRGRWWPKLGLFLLDSSEPVNHPHLELVTLEVVLVPETADGSATVAVEHRPHCVAFRFEPPTCLSKGSSVKGDHDYYHMQFVSAPRVRVGVSDTCFPLPDQFPAFPIRARDFGSLVLALAVALYGRNFARPRGSRGVDLDLSPHTQERLKKAYEDLGYWAWD